MTNRKKEVEKLQLNKRKIHRFIFFFKFKFFLFFGYVIITAIIFYFLKKLKLFEVRQAKCAWWKKSYYRKMLFFCFRFILFIIQKNEKKLRFNKIIWLADNQFVKKTKYLVFLSLNAIFVQKLDWSAIWQQNVTLLLLQSGSKINK